MSPTDNKYAGRDLLDKWGVKPGMAIHVVGAGDPAIAGRLAERAGRPLANPDEVYDLVVYWPADISEVTPTLAGLRGRIKPNGSIWVVVPKKGRVGLAGMEWVRETAVIAAGLAAGLVDSKTAAVSPAETSYRFVIRLRDRPA